MCNLPSCAPASMYLGVKARQFCTRQCRFSARKPVSAKCSSTYRVQCSLRAGGSGHPLDNSRRGVHYHDVDNSGRFTEDTDQSGRFGERELDHALHAGIGQRRSACRKQVSGVDGVSRVLQATRTRTALHSGKVALFTNMGQLTGRSEGLPGVHARHPPLRLPADIVHPCTSPACCNC
jgi:hypothetical protein